MARWTIRAAALAVAALVAACGGGEPAITSVKVMGDSLADSGTFGLKFTVQGTAATGAGSTPIWPEIISNQNYSPDLCPAYRQSATGFATAAGCTNYAIGGGRINYALDATNPLSIRVQLARAATVHGSYTTKDLLLIDGGGNDAADLVGAYLGAASSPAGALAYRNLLVSMLPPATVDGLLADGATGAALAGGAYMQALAVAFHGAIKTHALDKGAQKVVLLNMPDITLTPRFAAVLAGVAQAYGGGAAGQAAAGQLQGLIRQWIGAFNNQLATQFTGISSVAILDFYGVFTDQVNNPAKYGFTNVKDTACPATGTGSDGLPAYSFPTCTVAALSAKPPAGAAADWWKSYIFSDGFHPTPKGHELMAAEVAKLLSAKGWNKD